jgi:glycosyltransferase involved in cell wall biosynthesis
VKLVIQIPCFNERENLKETLVGLPQQIPGIDCIEVLIVDDGSTDGTAIFAKELGVRHVVVLQKHQGLAIAFMKGIDAALKLGADIIVNTDADHQYPGDEIPKIIEPVRKGRADMVIGNRQTDKLLHFSPTKRLFQRWGSRLVRTLSNTAVLDPPSGFRAMSRECALRLFVHNRFTYTLETVILAGQRGLVIEDVSIRTNPTARPSRLFRGTSDYLRRAGSVILRAYAMYRPVQLVGLFAVILFFSGVLLGGRFLYYYLKNPNYSGYTQSLVVGTGAVVIAFMLGVAALISELIASNRRLLEEILLRVRRLEYGQQERSTVKPKDEPRP